MAVIADLPLEFRPFMRTMNKGTNKIIDTIANTVLTPKEKADKIVRIFSHMNVANNLTVNLLTNPNVEADIDLE